LEVTVWRWNVEIWLENIFHYTHSSTRSLIKFFA